MSLPPNGDRLPSAPSNARDGTITSIWDELNKWGENLVGWQQFVLAHAVRGGKLSSEQMKDAYKLFLNLAQLDEGSDGLPEIPESITGRTVTGESPPLKLLEMGALQHVNALPAGAHLPFGEGLTVIYGQNGAGKSGFARMLASACFARSDVKILANVFRAEKEQKLVPECQFQFSSLGKDEEVVLFRVGDEHPNLKQISFFDSNAARIRLSKESALGFQLAGFDVFDTLIEACSQISSWIDEDVARRRKPNNFSKLFADKGEIAEKVSSIHAGTDVAELRALAVFTADDEERLQEIARQQVELAAESPTETLRTLESAKEGLRRLRESVVALELETGSPADAQVCGIIRRHEAAMRKLLEAGARFTPHPKLRQVGSAAWDDFVASSRTLGAAEAEAYPSEADVCLLCHRPLDEPSITLIRRMWSYLDCEARTEASKVNEELDMFILKLRNINLNFLPEDSVARSNLAKCKPEILRTIDNFLGLVRLRLEHLEKCLVDLTEWTARPVNFAEIIEKVDHSIAEIEREEAVLRAGEYETQIERLKAERIFIRQEQTISMNIKEICEFVKDLAWIEKASKSKPNTRFITDKHRALFQVIVENVYSERLREECALLDCSLPVQLRARGQGGKTVRGLKVQSGHNPDDIFSEGEQRALALADFLTEVHLNPHSAAIVLDDPVTSMDHKRKNLIASRLVRESTERQVIVFTHDMVFLRYLSDKADTVKAPVDFHWIESIDNVPGHVNIGVSPASGKEYRTTKVAQQQIAYAKNATGQKRVDYLRASAGALRRTLEEAVERFLFKGSIQRWDEQIRLGSLSKIQWSNDLADEFVSLQAETSRLLEGHSHSDEYTGELPDVQALENLVSRVDAVLLAAKMVRN